MIRNRKAGHDLSWPIEIQILAIVFEKYTCLHQFMECKRELLICPLLVSCDTAGSSRKRTKLGEQLFSEPLTQDRIHDFFNVKETHMNGDSSTVAETQTPVSKAYSCDSPTDEPRSTELRDLEPEAELWDHIDEHVLAEHKPNEWLHQQVTKEVGLEDAEKFVENLSNVVPVWAKPNTVYETPQHKAECLRDIENAVESGLCTL